MASSQYCSHFEMKFSQRKFYILCSTLRVLDHFTFESVTDYQKLLKYYQIKKIKYTQKFNINIIELGHVAYDYVTWLQYNVLTSPYNIDLC